MSLAEIGIKIFAPFDCIYCGKEGPIVCRTCRNRVIEPVVSRCYKCRKATVNSLTCSSCRRLSVLRNVWVVTELNEASRPLLYAFKFKRAQTASTDIGELIAGCLPKLPANTLIVPVPTATSRVRQRGYDHALLLAKVVGRRVGLPCNESLVRLTQSRQVGSRRELRVQQLKEAYRLRRGIDVKGRTILLIDDVLTTGATLESAARALHSSGAGTVMAVAFAQK